jgi:exonuclease SbcC
VRLHRLELTAFGPFPGTEAVDFDALNAAGLFLLTGPTGAGKTSILDAICFALYGAVPGSRNGAKAFKSDHASADVVPSVSLELTIRDRRIKVVRQPGWARPSSRAKAGVVEEKTKAHLSELVDGVWVAHSNRVDEVGQLVTSLLGMNKDQFCQVVLLPQGEFQTFLSAGAKERHDVLESLFRTQRFQAIERWLVDHRRGLDEACRAAETGIDRLVARVDEVLAGIDRPGLVGEGVDAEAQPAVAYADLPDLLRTRRSEVTVAAATASEAKVTGDEQAKAAQHALDTAHGLLDRQRKHREAQNRMDELTSALAEVRRREREIMLARNAAAFVPLLDLVAEADRQDAQAEIAVTTASAAWGSDTASPPTNLADAIALVESVQRELVQLDDLLVTEQELQTLQHSIAELTEALGAERARETELRVRIDKLPDELAVAREQLAEAHQAVTQLPGLAAAVEAARAAHAAAERAAAIGQELEELEPTLLSARELRADAREQLHEVRARRLAGMAAQLAAGLEPDKACPVCGSHEHPSPAAAGDSDVSAEDEQQAEDVVRRAEDAVGELELQRERLRGRMSTADHAAGAQTVEQTALAVDSATERHGSCAETAAQLDARQQRLAELEQLLATEQTTLADVRGAVHTVQAQLGEQTKAAEALTRRIVAAIGSGTSVTHRRASTQGRLSAAQTLTEALRRQGEAHEALVAAGERLDQLVAASVFATVRQVRDALRSDADVASAEALNRKHSVDKATTQRILSEPDLLSAAQAPAPDVAMLAVTAEQAAAEAAVATATLGRLELAADRLDTLQSDVDRAVSAWQPLRIRRDRADHVAALVAGTSRDNLTKTKLSHYVLAARLEQVVDAANVRLRGICGGRYELEHTLMRGVGDARGGLGLRVLDSYTGVRRDPATLSGGETFYVSLALALGLADLVNNEIGGTELSTLFVDEGFGMLDADTLDEVMDELDALRSGGRSVGLVSHLAELRTRVPARLSVVRSPDGSRLADS